MPETWLPFAEKRPGPAAKQGYASDPNRTFAEITGIVAHSMEGSLAAALGELDNPARSASWTLSNPKSGPLQMHYPLESITWASGSQEANRRFLAIESEGIAGEPLTSSQVNHIVDVFLFMGFAPVVRKTNAWEHNEMTAFGSTPTACPSGRYPWSTIIQQVEANMTLTADQEAKIDKILSWLEADIDAGTPGAQPRIARIHERVEQIYAAPPGSLTATQVRQIVREELNKTKLGA